MSLKSIWRPAQAGDAVEAVCCLNFLTITQHAYLYGRKEHTLFQFWINIPQFYHIASPVLEVGCFSAMSVSEITFIHILLTCCCCCRLNRVIPFISFSFHSHPVSGLCCGHGIARSRMGPTSGLIAIVIVVQCIISNIFHLNVEMDALHCDERCQSPRRSVTLIFSNKNRPPQDF